VRLPFFSVCSLTFSFNSSLIFNTPKFCHYLAFKFLLAHSVSPTQAQLLQAGALDSIPATVVLIV
jgi:hypothetical protein